MADIEFYENEPGENVALNRPAPKTYSEAVQWLMGKGYFKSELGAKTFLICLSCLFFALSFYFVYIASMYVQTEKPLDAVNLQEVDSRN